MYGTFDDYIFIFYNSSTRRVDFVTLLHKMLISCLVCWFWLISNPILNILLNGIKFQNVFELVIFEFVIRENVFYILGVCPVERDLC